MRNSIIIFISAVFLAAPQAVCAQSGSSVMPFLLMDSDARTAGMAGAGAILPDNPSAALHNAAAILTGERSGGAAVSAGPWNTAFDAADVLCSAGGYWNIDGRNGIVAAVRYVPGDKIALTDDWGYPAGEAHPYDLAAEIGYARGFGEHFSAALTARYLRSDLGLGEAPMQGVSFDLAGVYRHGIAFRDGAQWSVGLKIADLGPSVKSGTGAGYALPMRATASGHVRLPFSEDHVLNVVADIGCRFSPASFEAAAGAEYVFLRHGIVRAGFHAGDALSGGNYAAAGCGFIAGPVSCSASWRFAGDGPLDNTICFTLALLL